MRNRVLGFAFCLVILSTDIGQAQHQVPSRAGSRSAMRVSQPQEIITEESDAAEFSEAESYADCGADCMGCDICGPCLAPSRLWFEGGVLLWTTSSIELPALATSSPLGTPQAETGVLGAPGTEVVIGNNDVYDDLRVGGRFSLGFWLDDCQTTALETSFFLLDDGADRDSVGTGDYPLLARPFFDLSIDAPRSQLISYPSVASGSVSVDAFSEVASSETMIRKRVRQQSCYQTDVVFGYRYFRIDEGVRIEDQLTALGAGGPIAVGTTISGFDHFETENEFHGGQIGMVFNYQRARWSARITGKVAIGRVDQTVIIDGRTRVSVPGGDVTVTETGLLAQESNIGEYSRDRFAVIPELGLNLGYSITPRLTATAGYTFIYINNVTRPDDQIDLSIDPGGDEPQFAFKDTDFWAQGVNFGLEYKF